MAEKTLTVVIQGDAKGITKAFRETQAAADDTESRLSKLGSQISPGMAAAAGAVVAGVGLLVKGAFDAAEESARIARETERVVRTTGASAWTSAEQVGDLAGSISQLTGADDEMIQSGANLILTFTNIKNAAGEGNDVFDRATQSALDLSVALGTDMNAASIQVGKALNDPIKGITALSRAGVSFSEDQKKAIRTMVETGDVLGAQKVILGELERQFGGAAEAAATPLDRLMVTVGNLQEQLGAALIPVVGAAADVLSGLVSGFAALPGPIQAVALGVTGLGVSVAGGVVVVAKLAEVFGDVLGPAMQFFRAYADDAALGVANLITKMGGSQDKALSVATSLTSLGPAMLGATAIAGGALLGFTVLQGINAQKAQEQKKRADEFTAAIEQQTGVLQENVNAVIAQQFANEGVGDILKDTSADVKLFGDSIVNAGDRIRELSDEADTGRLENFEDDLRSGAEAGDALSIEMLRLRESGELSTTQLMELANQLDDTSKAYREGEQAAQLNKGITDAMATSQQQAATAAQQYTDSVKEQNDELRAMFDPLFAANNALVQNQEAVQKANEAAVGAYVSQNAYNEAVRVFGANSPQATEAARKLDEANRGVNAANINAAKSAMDVDSATRNLSAAMSNQSVTMDGAKAKLAEWVGQGLLTEAQAQQVADKLGGIAYMAAMIPKNVTTNVSAPGADTVIAKFNEIAGAIRNAGGAAQVYSFGVGSNVPAPFAIQQRASGGPVTAGSPYIVGEEGPEFFVPSSSGVIIPNGSPVPAMAGAGSRGGDTYNIYQQPGESTAELVDRLSRHFKRNGGSPWDN